MTDEETSPHARAASQAGRLVGSALFWLGVAVVALALLVGVGLPALYLAVLAITDPPPDPGDGRANAFGGIVAVALLALTTLLPAGVVISLVGAVLAWLGDGLALGPVGQVPASGRTLALSVAGRAQRVLR